jgi:hypothetical protein
VWQDRLVLAEVSMSQEGLVSAFDVEEAPAILVLPPPEDKVRHDHTNQIHISR